DSAPRWSDNGTQLAFLSDREGGERQLYVMSARGGEPRRLTSMPSHAGPGSWSPDGTRIAFSAWVWLDPPPDDAGARERWKQRPRHVTKAQDPGLGDPMVRVWTVPSRGGQPRRLTERYDRGAMLLPVATDTPGPMWSRDNASVTFIAGDHGNAHLVRAVISDGSTSVVVGG